MREGRHKWFFLCIVHDRPSRLKAMEGGGRCGEQGQEGGARCCDVLCLGLGVGCMVCSLCEFHSALTSLHLFLHVIISQNET